ncbi:MAG TPA: PilN domain-containing protein [Patescibacteria group bacterium]|nr:PilN domain-containing protein [Patescibacteria group bacterium]
MIRINLISEAIPQARGEPARLAGAAQAVVLALCLALAVGWLVFDYYRTETAVTQVEHQLAVQRVALARLNRLRTEVATFQQQKTAIDRRIQLITQLDANRIQSQQLLESIADTVDRIPLLWLTGLSRKGNSLTIKGQAGSIDAVASFLSQLRRSGHFSEIQMKRTQQQPNSEVTSFNFSVSADYQATPAAATAQGAHKTP